MAPKKIERKEETRLLLVSVIAREAYFGNLVKESTPVLQNLIYYSLISIYF